MEPITKASATTFASAIMKNCCAMDFVTLPSSTRTASSLESVARLLVYWKLIAMFCQVRTTTQWLSSV
jgi:hypothetical protein